MWRISENNVTAYEARHQASAPVGQQFCPLNSAAIAATDSDELWALAALDACHTDKRCLRGEQLEHTFAGGGREGCETAEGQGHTSSARICARQETMKVTPFISKKR